ncbi:MAG: thioredoxin-dependent thiol peroxidase [Chloroflexia bacterium]
MLKIGDTAPDFTLPTDDDKTLRLSDLRGQRVVLYFYPKDDTPGCTAQACGFRDAYPQIEEQNAIVLGVSPDSAASHRAFRSKYNLPFTLLVDADHAVADAYGAWGEKSFAGKKYTGITRSHFLIDEEGRVADVQQPVKPADSVRSAVGVLAG